MTTQELKEYINSKLGNSLRTLLPSYWWKRLFGLVVDRVEEVEGKVYKEIPELITSSLAEFAEKYPDIESRTFYLEGSTEKIEKNAALLRKVAEEYQNGIVQQVYLATLFNGETGKLIVTSPQFIVTSGFRFINVALPLFKVLKDVIINEDGTFALEDAKYIDYVDTSKFATTAQLQELDNILSDEIDGLKDSKQNTLVSGTNIKTINGESILGSGDLIIEEGSNIELDNAMSSTSENAVQNKVIKAYVDDAITNVTVTSDTELSSTSTNPVQNKVIKVALDDKVDKVEGKQLSTEDFTTELKEKLNCLSEISQSDEIYVGSEMPTDDNIVVWIDPDASIGDVDWDGITIDEEFSPTSTNPVQNKTVYTLLERLDGIEAILDNINGE